MVASVCCRAVSTRGSTCPADRSWPRLATRYPVACRGCGAAWRPRSGRQDVCVSAGPGRHARDGTAVSPGALVRGAGPFCWIYLDCGTGIWPRLHLTDCCLLKRKLHMAKRRLIEILARSLSLPGARSGRPFCERALVQVCPTSRDRSSLPLACCVRRRIPKTRAAAARQSSESGPSGSDARSSSKAMSSMPRTSAAVPGDRAEFHP